MADNKRGREEQSANADRRQRERDILAELERGDETRPPFPEDSLDELSAEIEAVSFPATGQEVVGAVGDRAVDPDRTHTVAELVPAVDDVIYDEPAAVTQRVQRPTIAAAMKRIVEASDTVPNVDIGRSQRQAYEKTLRALKAIDAVDNDEGITQITDWVVEQVADKQRLPGSRAVRRQAAKFCRAEGYEIRTDEWLGV